MIYFCIYNKIDIGDNMLKQKIIEIVVVAFALIAIMFAVCSYLFKENLVLFRILGIVFIAISFVLNIYSNYRKKKI